MSQHRRSRVTLTIESDETSSQQIGHKTESSMREGPLSPQCVRVCAQATQSCPTLCDPVDCSPLGSSVHGILQARILEWVALPSSRGSSPPWHLTCISCIARGFFTAETPGKPISTVAPKLNPRSVLHQFIHILNELNGHSVYYC